MQRIDELAAAFALELDEGKRKALFDQFQKHLYDDAVVMKAGNYGIFQAATVKLKNFVPYRIPRMWGTLGSQPWTGERLAASPGQGMGRFLIRRFAGAAVVLLLVSLMTFAMIWLVPGDPASAFLDASATPEQVARLRSRSGSTSRCRCRWPNGTGACCAAISGSRSCSTARSPPRWSSGCR